MDILKMLEIVMKDKQVQEIPAVYVIMVVNAVIEAINSGEWSIQELGHAMALHDFAVQDIEQLKTVYPNVPQKMQDSWDKSHVDFVEKTAWIKQMQAM